MRWLDSMRTRLQGLLARTAAESRMNDEFRLHLDLETEKLVREQDLAPEEARRRAMAAFGGIEAHKEALRDGRGLARLGGFSLDLRLAARLLVKYPGLTLVSVAALAFGIAAGVAAFELWKQFVGPSDDVRLGLLLGNAFVVMLLLLVSANVALLMFARTATRESEITVRSALGAGRARIIAQLVVEGFALAAPALAIGLVVARFLLRSFLTMYEADTGQPLPFWMNDRLTPLTVIYAGALTMLAVSIVGVIPAWKATGRSLEVRLRQSTAGGGGPRFGGMWTAAIAAQVAVSIAFPAAAFFFHRWVVGSLAAASIAASGPGDWVESQYLSRLLAVVSAIALTLSLTAIYSVMAVTVSRRTREIGIRVALGADRRRVIGVILRRPLAQVGIGGVLGVGLVTLTHAGVYDTAPTPLEAVLTGLYAIAMIGVCLLGCIGPARRALSIQPAKALAVDG